MGKDRIAIRLLGTVSVLGLFIGMGAQAQELQLEPASEPEGFLGTVELGQGKREVQVSTAAPVTVINQEELDDRQAGSVAELVDSVPGVTLVNGSRPQGSGLNIRGFGATSSFGTDQKVQILIDGASTGSEELYRIGTQLFTDPELYKEVSVIRGTIGSFEFGSGIIGGVVQLETKDASDFTGGEVGLRFRQTLGASTNAEGFVTSSILAWQPTENLEVLFNYTLRDVDAYKGGDGQLVPNTESRMPSYLGKATYSFGDNLEHSITASYNYSETDEKDVPYDTFGTTGGSFGNVDRKVTNEIAGLRYRWNPVGNDLIDLDVNLTQSTQHIVSNYVAGSSPLEGTPSGPRIIPLADADQDYEITKLTAKNSMYFVTGIATHDLRIGFELMQKERLNAPSAPGGTDKRIALFAVDDIGIGDHWTFTPAMRFETQDIEAHDGSVSYDNSALMGGLSARYAFDNGWAIFGSGAYTENLPIIDDLGTPRYMTMPERSHTFELGASYATTDLFAGGDALQAKVNLFRSTLWDITSYVDSTFVPIQEVNSEGIEIEATYSMESGFYADFNAAIGEYDEVNSTGVAGIWRNAPADSARLTLGKRIGAAWDLSWELVGAKSFTDSTGSKVNGYGVSNLRATYRVQTGVMTGAEVRLGIENAFDKAYTPALATRTAPGRNVKLTLAKTF
ncbi:TonB-dependent receptor domain-containing protein [Phycobacter azelaicus]|uniref:TonB-dependent receptor domain-containing protein n=1 Tax=Phycobacter azelaicus TaxID=2668075 RepID=UPI0018672E23|nr:TonB-dependent receptor [Phycobacter azelaicus]